MLINDIFKETLGGQIMSRITTENEKDSIRKINVLIPKAIENGEVIHSNLVENYLSSEIDDKKITKKGDIILKLSTPYEACIIKKEDEGLAIPSFCAVLRELDNDYDPYFVLAYINSNYFKNQVQTLISGATIGILSIGQVRKIEIPKKSVEIQKEIASQYIGIIKNNSLIKKLISLQEEKLDTLIAMED